MKPNSSIHSPAFHTHRPWGVMAAQMDLRRLGLAPRLIYPVLPPGYAQGPSNKSYFMVLAIEPDYL